MRQILYDNRCRCKEELSVTKKRKISIRSKGKPLQYPKDDEIKSRTFQIKYPHKLSLTSKFILNSFQNKYVYYAIDDILYTFKFSSMERENLLAILYSPILSLQNDFSINFFDIWISEIYIEERSKTNKFVTKNSQILNQFSYITIRFLYKTKVLVKKQESLW
jgi:hypothetical protein